MNIYKKIKRYLLFTYQYWTRGFSNKELWNLDKTVTKFVLPRLKEFKRHTMCHPSNISYEEWQQKLDMMIEAFELNSTYEPLDREQQEKVKHGMLMFAWYFQSLWW